MRAIYPLVGVLVFLAILMPTGGRPVQSGVTSENAAKDYLVGDDITEEKLQDLIEKYFQAQVYLAFFGSPGCSPCDDAWDTITQLEQEYSPRLEARRFDPGLDAGLLENLFKLYNLSDDNKDYRKLKWVFVSDTEPPWEMVEPSRPELPGAFTIAVAGLADGVNPCAFAVVVFFVSYLTYLGRKRREIMLVGVFFILAVFLTYFLVGVGILLFVRELEAYPIISSAVRISIAGLAIAFGLLSLYDYYLFRKKGAKAMKLQLPRALKGRMHAIIRKTRKTAFIIPFAFAIGIVISLFELGCTGQIYLPTIAYVIGEPGLQVQAFLYLILYNLMFILPLIVIFGLASFGVRSRKLAEFGRRHTGKTKIILAAILFVLAALLLTLG
jgi:cytochrome c biogenesis protein CcdA